MGSLASLAATLSPRSPTRQKRRLGREPAVRQEESSGAQQEPLYVNRQRTSIYIDSINMVTMEQQNNLSLASDNLMILKCVDSSRAVGRGENCAGQVDRAERGCSTESDSGLDVTPEGTPYTR